MNASAERVNAGGAGGDAKRAVVRAVAALRDGGLVIAPSEAGYVALAQVEGLPRGPEQDEWAKLLPDAAALAAALSDPTDLSRVQERLVRRLSPGPVIFRRGGQRLGLRATSRATLASVAEGVDAEVAAVELESRGRIARVAQEAEAAAADLGLEPALVIDGGAATLGRPCTVILLTDGGGYEVVREGAYERRFVDKQLEQRILFVCTGNTCRSPMAEAIAADLLKGMERATRTTVASAGVGAAEGAPVAEDAVAALKEVGVEAASLGRGRSRRLTPQMIAEADVIIAMTASHRQAVVSMDPSADGRVLTLEEGGDIPDPIGLGREVYIQTARRIREALQRRLKELVQ